MSRHVYDDAPGFPEGAKELFAWVAVDAMDGEGLVANVVQGLGVVPFVAASEALARSYRPLVLDLAAHVHGRRFELRRYSPFDVIDTVTS